MAAYNLVIGIFTVLLVYVHTGRFNCAYSYTYGIFYIKRCTYMTFYTLKLKLLDQEMYCFKILT